MLLIPVSGSIQSFLVGSVITGVLPPSVAVTIFCIQKSEGQKVRGLAPPISIPELLLLTSCWPQQPSTYVQSVHSVAK